MTDRDLRKAQRAGDANRARVHRYRAGLPWPLRVLEGEGACECMKLVHYGSVLGKACGRRCNGTGKATPCHATTWEGPSREVVRSLAYVGDGWAREVVVDWTPVLLHRIRAWDGMVRLPPHVDTWSLTDWLTGLLRFCSALPPLRVEIPCPSLHDYSSEYACDCSGTRTLEITAERYVSVLAAWAAGVEALPVWVERHPPETGVDPGAPRRALAAARSWLACPCGQGEARVAGHEWLEMPTFATNAMFATYCDDSDLRSVINEGTQRSARLTSPETVRTAVSEAWMEVAGGR